MSNAGKVLPVAVLAALAWAVAANPPVWTSAAPIRIGDCASAANGAAKRPRASVTTKSHSMRNLMAFSPCRFTGTTVGVSLHLPPGHVVS